MYNNNRTKIKTKTKMIIGGSTGQIYRASYYLCNFFNNNNNLVCLNVIILL